MSNKKVILKLIILILIIVLAIIILLIKMEMDKINSTDYNLNTEFEQIDTYEVNSNIEKLNNKNKYYAVKDILNRYVNYIYQFINSDDAKIKEMYFSELFNMIDKDYIKEFNITEKDLHTILEQYDYSNDIRINDIYILEKSSSINVFIIYFRNLVDNKEHRVLIKTDSANATFSIYLEDYINKYDINENSEDINISDISIEENKSNKFSYKNISEEQMAINYFQDFRWMVLNDKNELYSKIDEQYKNSKFTTKNDYNSYFENLKEEITGRSIKEYQIKNEENYKQYICIDQKGKYYIFRETAIMEYSIILDPYTIDLPEFIEKYNNSDEQTKVALNIDKFITAINYKDYNYSYKILAESFKQNKYPNIETFKKFIQENLYENNEIQYKEFTQQGSNYIYKIKITDKDSEKENDMTIVMKLHEGTEFEMSFSME